MHGNTAVILSSLLLSLASFAFSYDSGIYPVVRASLSRPATDPSLLTDDAFQLTHLLISVLSAALAAPVLCDRLGRRITMLLSAVLLTLAGAIQSSSDGIVHYFVGRIANAIAGGTMWVAVFLYETEVVPKKWRGAAICLQVWAFALGQLAGKLCQMNMQNSSWRVLTEVECIIGAILCVGVYLIPSSPRWLLSRGRDQAALIVLAKLRADGDPGAPDVVDEYDGVKRMVNPDRQERAQWVDLLHGTNLRRLVLAILLHVFAGLVFVEGIQAWVAELGVAGGQVPSADGGAVVWAIAAVFMYAVPVVSVVVVDRIGRRALIVWGACVMAISLVSLGALVTVSLSALPRQSTPVVVWYSDVSRWAALSLSYLSLAAFHSTLLPISYLYPTEIFPAAARAKALGLATALRWISDHFLSLLLPRFVVATPPLCLFVIAGLCAVLALVVWWTYPETNGLSLEDVEALFIARWGNGSETGGTGPTIDFIVPGSSPSRSRRSTPLSWIRLQYYGGQNQPRRTSSAGTVGTAGSAEGPDDLADMSVTMRDSPAIKYEPGVGVFGYSGVGYAGEKNVEAVNTYSLHPPSHQQPYTYHPSPPPQHQQAHLAPPPGPPPGPPPRSPNRPHAQPFHSPILLPHRSPPTLSTPPPPSFAPPRAILPPVRQTMARFAREEARRQQEDEMEEDEETEGTEEEEGIRPDLDIDNMVRLGGPRYTPGGSSFMDIQRRGSNGSVEGVYFPWRQSDITELSSPAVYSSEAGDSAYTYI